jgi:hypothetical protein
MRPGIDVGSLQALKIGLNVVNDQINILLSQHIVLGEKLLGDLTRGVTLKELKFHRISAHVNVE